MKLFRQEVFLKDLDLNDTEEIVAVCYLQKANDEANKVILTNERLVVVYLGKHNYYQQEHILAITFSQRRSMAPLIVGGIIAPLSFLAIFNNLFPPWPLMVVFFLSVLSFYFGWLGHIAFTIEEPKASHDFIIKTKSKNLEAFVDFTLKYMRNKSDNVTDDIMIYHLVTQIDWRTHQAGNLYTPSSVSREGFIHCSTRDQLEHTMAKYFKDRSGLLIVAINPLKVKSEIKYEPPTPPAGNNVETMAGGETAGLFPHIYGSLNIDAVVKLTPVI